MRRGWRGRCPRCAHGALFGGFLKMRSHCRPAGWCSIRIRADDAPPISRFSQSAILLSRFVLVFERYGDQPPLWVHAALWLPLSVLMALILLPRIKGAVIALLWAHRIAAPKIDA
jgi:uncharacterized protein (DUF983 family)